MMFFSGVFFRLVAKCFGSFTATAVEIRLCVAKFRVESIYGGKKI